jgi:hypothetical protein
MKRQKPKTYEADFRGKKVRVTVPENDWVPTLGPDYGGEGPGSRHCSVAYSGDSVDVLRDVLKDNLSPQAVAAVAVAVGALANRLDGRGRGEMALHRELRWFADLLLDMLGGQADARRLCDEAEL